MERVFDEWRNGLRWNLRRWKENHVNSLSPIADDVERNLQPMLQRLFKFRRRQSIEDFDIFLQRWVEDKEACFHLLPKGFKMSQGWMIWCAKDVFDGFLGNIAGMAAQRHGRGKFLHGVFLDVFLDDVNINEIIYV